MGRRNSGSILYDLFRLPWWVSGTGLLVMLLLNAFWSVRSANAEIGIFQPMLLVVSLFIQIGIIVSGAGLVLSAGRAAWLKCRILHQEVH